MRSCAPGDGKSRAFVQDGREDSGGLLLGPVGRTHTETPLRRSSSDTHTGMQNCPCEDSALNTSMTGPFPVVHN